MTKPIKHKNVVLSESAYIICSTDKEIHKLYLNGPQLKWAIDDFIHQSLRNRLKHTKLTKREAELLETVRCELMDHVGEYL